VGLRSTVFWWLDQFEVINAKSDCQFVKSDYSGITVSLFKAADVLLTEARDVSKLLLRQPLFLPKSSDVPADQPAHIHAQRSADYTL
jgi:hypothetical protein